MSDADVKKDAELKKKVVDAVKAIKKGPRAMRMYMEMCAKCGTCATVCPVYYGKAEKRYNPAERTDVIRRIYRKHCTLSGSLLGKLAGAEDFEPADIKEWEKIGINLSNHIAGEKAQLLASLYSRTRQNNIFYLVSG